MTIQPTTLSPLTIDELVVELQKLQAQGKGSLQASIPFTPPHTTMGGTPKVGILSVQSGFDWDNNSVFLTPSEKLGKLDAEQKEYGQKMANRLGLFEYSVRKILGSEIFSAEERLEQIDQILKIHENKMLSSLKSPSPNKSHKP